MNTLVNWLIGDISQNLTTLFSIFVNKAVVIRDTKQIDNLANVTTVMNAKMISNARKASSIQMSTASTHST